MKLPRLQLPGTALEVFPLCLGVAEIGVRGSEEDAFRLLDHFLQRGGNWIDTARIYSDWIPGERHRSERILGAWLADRGVRDRVVLSTKGCHPPLDDWDRCCHEPDDVRREILGSLETLGTGCIDLWWFHRDDLRVPVGELVDAVNVHLRKGEIAAWGVSNWSAARVAAALEYARTTGQAPPVAVQNFWNLGSRHHKPFSPQFRMVAMDDALLALHTRTGLAAVPYSSQANGFFSKWAEGDGAARAKAESMSYACPANFRVAEAAAALARRHGVPINAVVLAWLIQHPFPVVPLVGCHDVAQLDATLDVLGFRLPPEDLAALAAALRMDEPSPG